LTDEGKESLSPATSQDGVPGSRPNCVSGEAGEVSDIRALDAAPTRAPDGSQLSAALPEGKALRQQTSSVWQRHAFSAALLAVLALALTLRLYHVNWDENQHAHPDERWISMVAADLRWPDKLSDLLNPRASPLNPLWSAASRQPRSFAYGHLPLYALALLANALERVATLAPHLRFWPGLSEAVARLATASGYDEIALLGRVVSALADFGVIVMIYAMGRKLHGRAVGLLAAAFVTLTVSHIQASHFYTFDTFATFFIVLTAYGSLGIWRTGHRRDIVLAGVAAGMAVASKFSALPVLAAPAVAILARALALQEPGTEQVQDEHTQGGWRLHWQSDRLRFALQQGLLCLGVALAAFAITSPFAILDYRRFVLQIAEQGAMVRGIADLPYTRQYRNTPAYWYQIEQQLRWGMGWPLGLAAFVGFGWYVLRNLRRPRWGEMVLLAWVIPYFVINGSFMVKFMRYMLPLLPFLSLMGAALLREWRERAQHIRRIGRWRWRPTWLVNGLIAIVLVGSLAYALAFVGIYARTHTWIAASRWIYENVPQGATIAVEHWDDSLPKSLSPTLSQANYGYRHLELPMYEPDTRAKFDRVYDVLQQADYVILATNRLYRSIPRLPERYPLSTAYYRLLFAEQLGFAEVATFASYPQLGGWVIVDDAADESFTVYDHPKPIIFRKERELSRAEFDALFAEAYQIQPQVEGHAVTAYREQVKKDLLLDQPVGTLPVVRGIGWNALANNHTVVAVVFWWLIVQMLGVLALPLTYVIFHRLRDRGYLLAKTLGWLLVGWGVWWLASLRWMMNAWPTLLLCAASLGGLSFLIWRQRRREMASWLRQQWRLVLCSEAVFALAYLAFVIIRILNPDLWQPWYGGEKMMEMAFLNAILRSPYFPPYDPYFAGGYINYYYYGQYLVSLLIKLSGVIPSIGFNLAIPTLFALTVGNACSVGYNLATSDRMRKLAGLSAAILIALIGNLTAMTQLVGGLLQAGASLIEGKPLPLVGPLQQLALGIWGVLAGRAAWPEFDYWNASTRVIDYTINEFPYFSFLFADLHPHMIDIPFTLLALGLALNLVLSGRTGSEAPPEGPGTRLLRFALLPVVLGALGAINTWDLPTYLGVTALAFALQSYLRNGRIHIISAAVRAIAVGLLSLLLYWPFHSHYQAIAVGVGLVKERSGLPQILAIWGFFCFLVITYLFKGLRLDRSRSALVRYWRVTLQNAAYLPHLLDLQQALVRRPTCFYTLGQITLWGALLAAGALIILKQPTLAFFLPLLALATVLLWRDRAAPEEHMTHLLVWTGLLILFGVEIVFLKDFLAGGAWQRMNTLFKFYIQVWVLLGLALGAALPCLWAWVQSWHSRGWRMAWQAAFIFLLGSGLLYPLLATPARVQQRFPNGSPPIGTLDGMAYMTVGDYTWPDQTNRIELVYDYEAIRWLWDHVEGSPVIAEARLDYYREGGMRVSSFTGLPTLLGAHQGEQRYDWQVGPRDGLANELYNTRDVARKKQIITELQVAYIYVGQLERTIYDPAGLAAFEAMVQEGWLRIVYENQEVRIYRTPAG